MNRKKTNVTYLEDIKTEPQPEIMRFKRDLLKNHMGKIRCGGQYCKECGYIIKFPRLRKNFIPDIRIFLCKDCKKNKYKERNNV